MPGKAAAMNITPLKRKNEKVHRMTSAASSGTEKSPKKSREGQAELDDVNSDQGGCPASPTIILRRAIHSSRTYLGESGDNAPGNTLPSPPAAAAAAAAAVVPEDDQQSDDQDRKMPGGKSEDSDTLDSEEAAQIPDLTSLSSTPSRRFSGRIFSGGFEPALTAAVTESPDQGNDGLADVEAVDAVFRQAAALAAITWVLLVLGTYTTLYFFQSNHTCNGSLYVHEDDIVERRVPQTAFFILLVGTFLQISPLILHRLKSNDFAQGPPKVSGILISAMVILSISLITNALLGWGPRAVIMDPVTGSRVFLLRWCEWTPLAGFMTLLAESADVSTHPKSWRAPMLYSLCQTLSTLCGIILPLCRNTTEWMIVITISGVLYLTIFPRVQDRKRILEATPSGRTVLERENYDRRRFAYWLMAICAIVWTILVSLYFVNIVIHMTVQPNHWLRFPSLAMSCDTIADVVAKVVYTRIIVDAHQAVFASDIRIIRQLNELKQLMAMLWVSSSDVIVISTKQTKHRNATMLSPSFLSLVGASVPLRKSNPQDSEQTTPADLDVASESVRQSAALVLETERGKVQSAYYVDTSTVSGDPYPERIDHRRLLLAHEDLQSNAVVQALRITNTTWTTSNYNRNNCSNGTDQDNHTCEPLRALSIAHCDPSRSGKVMCEMKVSRHSEQTAVAVVRDVTERYRRFEAESQAHAETIARQRDMHTANRFTRHEVKNGLLAGIELCRTLGQSLDELKIVLQKTRTLTEAEKDSLWDIFQPASHLNDQALKSLVDLDGTLRGVLDTVLAEVMAREVVHEVYQPRLEETDVPSMLVANLGMSKDRIPVTVRGGSMPKLFLDAQLIGHIHRNAVSNACKYGKQGGLVQTIVSFDAEKQEFFMEVKNEPGDGQDTLLALGESASEFVFAQGVRLQAHFKGKTEKKLDSSGDGAWIMQKCAKTMNGICDIHFTKDLTSFTFRCPVVPVAESNRPNYREFVVPENVWGIGIDDSGIQRKLLSRIFAHAGVDASRQLMLGATHEDITEFESTLMNLMDEHPDKKFLVIVDEHLDYDSLSLKKQDGVHSGSLIMKQILDLMPKDHLARLLVLMRSANDSALDIALYTQRTHGYFPKAIMQRERTREILAPLWLARFPEDG